MCNKMKLQYPAVVLVLLLLSAPFRAYRLYLSRADALELLEAKEERLYFNSCDQSSNRATCVFAIDNGYSQEPTQCSLTNAEDEPWWLAVLEVPAYISKVTILNIDNAFRSHPDALGNIVVMANDEVCFRYKSEDIFVKRSFPCDVIADQIVIRSQLTAVSMGLCDVEVMGAPLKFPTALKENVLLPLSTCMQSSVDGNGYCENAFDGETNPNHHEKPCAVTSVEMSPWIEVNLYKPAIVTQIDVFNRADCCADGLAHMRITLNERVCIEYRSGVFESLSFSCKYFGDKVRIIGSQGKSMSVCEIQVLGHEAAINIPPKYMSRGCQKDTEEDRDLPTLVSSTRMSHKKCYGICNRNGMKYFGVQQGKFCFCGSSFGKHGGAAKKAESCNMACDGNKLDICGGIMYSSVFQILGPGETIPETIADDMTIPPDNDSTDDSDDLADAPVYSAATLEPPTAATPNTTGAAATTATPATTAAPASTN